MQNQNKLSTRLLSLALSAAMALTTFPVAAFAVEGNTAPQATSDNITTTRAITAFGELGEGFEKPASFDGHTYVLNVKANTPFAEVKLPTELSVTVEKTTTTTPPAKDEPVAEPVAEPVVEPVVEPVAEPTAEPVAEPVVEPVAEPTAEPTAEPVADTDTTVSGNEPAAPSGAEPAPAPEDKPAAEAPTVDEPKQENTVVVETAPENLAVTWKGDKEYTATENSTVVYTPVLPEGYALKDGVVLPTINVMVGKPAMAPMAAMPRAAGAVKTRTTRLNLTSDSISYVDTKGVTKTANPQTTSIKDTGEGWSWDKDTSTLTLSGANIDCTGNDPAEDIPSWKAQTGIMVGTNHHIVLAEGTTSTVKSCPSRSFDSYGVCFQGGGGAPSISGKGTLYAVGASAREEKIGCSVGVYSQDGTLTISDATIIATSSAKAAFGYGIKPRNIDIKSGTITSSGKTAAIMTTSGITAEGAIVTNGTADNGSFISGTTKTLTQTNPAEPVVVRIGLARRTTPLDLATNANITYIAKDGSTKTANPTLTGINDNDEGWSWDLSSKTLTLSGATIDCSGNVAATTTDVFGIQLKSDCKIVLTSGTTNTVKAGPSTAVNSYGVIFTGTGSPSISGTGTLNAMGNVSSGDFGFGISCQEATLTISDATINATSAGYGICADLDVQSGTITATGAGMASYGIHIPTLMKMSGGTVTAIGTGMSSYGIFGSSLNITSGTLSASGEISAVELGTPITAVGANVTGANEPFTSGTTKTLTQLDQAIPVVFNFGPISAKVERITPLDLKTSADITYISKDGTTSKTANPTLASIKDTGEGWAWDLSTFTLTLNNATINCSANPAAANTFGIKLPATATIERTDGSASTVKSGNCNGGTALYGIQGVNIAIKGTGKLTVNPGSPEVATVSVYGVGATGNVTVDDGELNVMCGTTGSTSNRHAFAVDGDITINSGKVTANSGTSNRNSSALNAANVIINGGEVNATTQKTKAIRAHTGNIQITGGSVHVDVSDGICLDSASGIVFTGTLINAKGDFVSGTTRQVNPSDRGKPLVLTYNPCITFDSRGGADRGSVELRSDITMPYDPYWQGTDYVFDGWYSGIDGKNAAINPAFTGKLTNEIAKTLTAAVTVYAKWTTKGGKPIYTQSFDFSAVSGDLRGDGYAWDYSNKTLTLDGVTIIGENSVGSTGSSSDIKLYAVKLPTGATINLVAGSENNLIGGNCTGSEAANIKSCGIYVGDVTSGILKIEGTGTLNTLGGAITKVQAGESYGISSSDGINIVSGTVTAKGDLVVSRITNSSEQSSSAGISADAAITIEKDATVNATGGKVNVTCENAGNAGLAMSNGILANGEFEFSNAGKLTVVGGAASYSDKNGQSVTENQKSFGILFDKITFMSPAVISAKGETAAIFTIKSITADKGSVTGAVENPFVSKTTKTLTQANPANPVEISFGPSIAVAAQSGIATYGTVANPTFAITSNSFGGTYPAFKPSVVWTSGNAPTGVTPTISGGTLTVATTAETLAGDYKFKVVSPKASPETGNYESAEATLTVNQLEATIAWDSTNSFAYNGKAQAPTATVSNKVGADDVTVTVAGKQTNVGTNYTATASAFEGAAAANYKLPTTKPTTTFAITAITITVNDGTLEVKKAFDSTTAKGIATGNLGLTGVLTADTANVSVKVDTVGAYADANVGKDKTVTLTISLDGSAKGNYALGSTSYSFTKAEITKVAYTGSNADAPDSTPTTKGDKSITIKPVTPPTDENVEYAKSTTSTPPTSDKDWQTGTTFNNLKPNTEYFFFARIKEGTNHAAGGVSTGVSITTDKSVYTGTQATAPTATKTHDTVTLNTQTISGETVEYGIDKNNDGTIIWQTGSTFDNLASNTEYKFYTRVKENGTHKAGATSAATAIKTKKAPVDVKGTVTDSKDVNLDNVLVELKQGDTVIKSDTTDTNGSYTLAAVPAGVYKLVITKGTAPNTVTITETVTVDGTPITGKDVKFLEGDKNTIVDSKPGAPTVAVDGMNDLLNDTNIGATLTPAEKAAVDANGSVELKFTADLKPLNENATDKSALESIAGNQKIDLLLDLSVLKIVKDASGKTITDGEKITNLAGLIKVHLPIPANMQGKAGLSLYRMHNGKPEKLSTTADANGEYYTVDTSGEFMTLYLKKFSTYAMGYNAFTVAMQNGGTGASGNGNYSNGDVVTISAGTKSGYSFSGWTVTVGNVTLANQSSATTTFTMPAENVVITANWTATGGSSTGGNGSSETYYYIKATAGIGGSINTPERVKVLVGESAGFSITPEKGYQIADVKVNGKSIGAKKYYVFTNVLSDQTIHATFKKAGHANPQTGVDVD